MKRVLVIAGTRPEFIKIAPVVRALRKTPDYLVRVCSTGQHESMAQQAFAVFGFEPDIRLDAMSSATSLGQLTSSLFRQLDEVLEVEIPDWVILQGDTTSSLVAAVSAFYRRIKIGHVEAGLRTYNQWAPFPEEINRTIISRVADLHFAPTEQAAVNLRREGVAANDIHVTGNTVVDALLWAIERLADGAPVDINGDVTAAISNKRLVLVTCHRRESFGQALESICLSMLNIVQEYPDSLIVFPVHLNPKVREPVYRLLGKHPRIKLVEPLNYLELVWLMQRSYCILTDSGGLQEEAPTLGKPLLILRETTERPEVIEAGCARLVGMSAEAIFNGAQQLFEDHELYAAMARAKNPFGDGLAANRIVDILDGKCRARP